jgi:hypothetical protein
VCLHFTVPGHLKNSFPHSSHVSFSFPPFQCKLFSPKFNVAAFPAHVLEQYFPRPSFPLDGFIKNSLPHLSQMRFTFRIFEAPEHSLEQYFLPRATSLGLAQNSFPHVLQIHFTSHFGCNYTTE